nr:xylanase [Clostridia bacterium]
MHINVNRTYQTLESFGTSGGWWAQYAGLWPDAGRRRIASLLFDPISGIGLTGYRYNLGAGSVESGKGVYWNEYRRAQSFEVAPGVYDWSKDAGAMWFAREATRLGCRELVLFMCSPLERMTINGMAQLTPGTTRNVEPTAYPAWAAYACDAAEHFLNEGLPVKYLSPINEPQWEWSSNNGQEGCHFEPEEIAPVYAAFLAEMKKRPALAHVELAGPESGEWGGRTQQYVGALMADASLRSHMSAIDCHSYWSNTESKISFRRFADTHFPEKRIRMSEWCEMVHGTDPGMDSAIVLAKCVQEDLTVLNAAHWCTWVAVSPRGYHDGVIHAWQEEDGSVQVMPLKRLWAYGNYTRFIRPGFARVEVTGNDELHPVAFTGVNNGRERLVIVLINEQDAPKTDAVTGDFTAYRTMEIHETSQECDLDCTYCGAVLQEITLPARSVVTLVLNR